jgi:alkanesulfonate monooxygenase SsuD/methylene tetrahydromethanopterin reductase-like flavin-dependent oxidoreductase (luciferase family)
MGDVETLRHKFQVLRDHCHNVGRNYDEIIRSSNLNVILLQPGENPVAATAKTREALGMSYEDLARAALIGDSDQVAERIQSMVDAGVNYVIVYFPRIAYDHEPMHRFAAEVIPRFS